MKEGRIRHQERMKREDLVSYLENLGDSIRQGKVVIEREDQFVSFDMPGMVKMDLSIKTKKEKGELSLELSWKQEAEALPATPGLRISSEEPVIPEPDEDETDDETQDSESDEEGTDESEDEDEDEKNDQ
ncbi:MAG: amphi-Trp domain-containing protein [Desulfobacteraceae bacterium]|nr:MAG: amphi-Trp domain-containing protein [Desulfobacteraceae bacterium]